MTRSSLVILACAIAFAVSVLLTARKLRVSERHTLVWLLVAAAIGGLAIWREGVEEIARAMGIYYPPSALFFVASGGILLFVYRLSLEIAALKSRVTRLAQEVALANARGDQPGRDVGAPQAELSSQSRAGH